MPTNRDALSTALNRLCLTSATFPARFCFAQDMPSPKVMLRVGHETIKTPISGAAAKLLVYEKGGFFVSHRDSEKAPRMVGTLVVSLPCRHKGGFLTVEHGSERMLLTASGASEGRSMSIAAFYADCQHRVDKIRSGHRVSLVFNLTVTPNQSTFPISPAQQSEPWKDAFASWDSKLQKVAILLEHRYTRSSVSWELLKGTDREMAQNITQGAKDAGCNASLALITYSRKGGAEPNHTGNNFYSHSYNWDTGKSKKQPSDLYDIYEEEIATEFWAPGEETPGDGKPLKFLTQEVFSDKSVDFHMPSAEEAEGYLGNEGVTVDQWYHRAAIVVWKKRSKV